MLGLLADVHCELHFEALLQVCRGPAWRDYWLALDVQVYSFESLGISRTIKDSALWNLCQRRQILLVTANRNEDGADSLQATIRRGNAADSLPVLTLANPDQILADASYASRAAIRMMEILTGVDAERGAGRLYLPATTEVEP